MLTILHGDDIAASRKAFLDLKQKHPDALFLEGEKLTLNDLEQAFASDGLFVTSKIVFIEQLLTKKKKSKERDELIEKLNSYASSHEIMLWEGKELDKSALTSVKTATVRPFKLPQALFAFLDALKPNNVKQLLSLFHQTLETSEAEMIFFMLIRHTRLLLALSSSLVLFSSVIPAKAGIYNKDPRVKPEDDKKNEIDELKRMAPWQKSKLERQAKLFENAQLLALYDRLFAIEFAQKTGNLTSSLVSTIDFFLTEI